MDWLRNGLLYEINTWVWLHAWSQTLARPLTLAELPAAAWDEISATGANTVWLMGVWDRSSAGLRLARSAPSFFEELRAAIPDLQPGEAIGSPYSIRSYEVDAHLGGPTALATARRELAARGIRLLLDFVPNHLGPDHCWTSEHPEWFIQGSERELHKDPRAFLALDEHVFARGRDPFFPPWSDVVQLNVFNQELRAAAEGELRQIARQCDGVRCDMAMLVLNDVFQSTWGRRAGPPPREEYWPALIAATKKAHPGFCFLAEAYWDREPTLVEQGFDFCYDKGFYDALVAGSGMAIRERLRSQDAAPWTRRQTRLVRFLENHDEPRAARVFPNGKGRAAAVIWATLPGLRLMHQGQALGARVKTPIHSPREPFEVRDAAVRETYRQLGTLLREVPSREEWSLCEVGPSAGSAGWEHLLAWAWECEGRRWLTLVNFGDGRAQARIELPWRRASGGFSPLNDWLASLDGRPSGITETGSGLEVELPPWRCHVFELRTA